MGFYGRETKICIEGILVGHLGLFPQAFDVIITTKQIYKCLHYVYTIGELKFFSPDLPTTCVGQGMLLIYVTYPFW